MGLFDGAADGTPSSTADRRGAARTRRSAGRRLLRAEPAPSRRWSTASRRSTARHTSPGWCSIALAPTATSGWCARRSRAWRIRFRSWVRCAATTRSRGATDTSAWCRSWSSRRTIADVRSSASPRPSRRSCDLEAIEAIARRARPPPGRRRCRAPRHVGRRGSRSPAVAAFSFSYPDNAEALDAAGAEIVTVRSAARRTITRRMSTRSWLAAASRK